MFVLYKSSSASSRRLVFRFVDPKTLRFIPYHFCRVPIFMVRIGDLLYKKFQEVGTLKHIEGMSLWKTSMCEVEGPFSRLL